MTTEQANQLTAIYNSTVLHSGDKVLLWTNSNPTSSFVAQTITLSTMSSYRYIIIFAFYSVDVFATYTSRGDSTYTLFPISKSDNTAQYLYSGVYNRSISINSTAKTLYIGSSNGQTQGYTVPLYIYGI